MAKRVQISPEEMLETYPPQLDEKGEATMKCGFCKKQLNPLSNSKYDATTEGFCDKLCRKDAEKKEAGEVR